MQYLKTITNLIEDLLKSTNGSLHVKPDPTSTAIGKLDVFRKTASVIRPADIIAYAIGDTISNSTTASTEIALSNVASEAGKSIRINKVIVKSNSPNIPEIDVWINTMAMTPNDNEAITVSDALGLTMQGCVSLTKKKTNALNSMVFEDNLADDYVCTSRDLYLMLESRETWTPVSGDLITIEVYYSQIN